MASEPTVYVVDDNQANRLLLQRLMEAVDLPVETFASGQAFLDAYHPEFSGCLLLDVRMPGMSGLELQNELHERSISMPVIIVTAHADVPMAVRALKAQAFEFIEKPFNHQAMLDTVYRALEEDARIQTEDAARAEIKERLTRLTPRERDVLDHVVAGTLNKQIAHELGISVRTVEIHRTRVMKKMETSSLAELVKMVLQIDSESA